MGRQKWKALADFIGKRDEQALDPAALDFTMKPWAKGRRTCLFSGQWSSVCSAAGEKAKKQGMRDCQDGFIYIANAGTSAQILNATKGTVMPKENSEVLIASGLHQFQHGRISKIDTSTSIPFAHIALRGARGQILVTRGAYVPLKYCVEMDAETLSTIEAEAKARRKARRKAEKESIENAAGNSAVKNIDWE